MLKVNEVWKSESDEVLNFNLFAKTTPPGFPIVLFYLCCI